jgi:molybdopterin-binding protein
VASSEVARLLTESRSDRPFARESVRNHFDGVITEVKRDGLVATVEIVAGPHRVLSLITREAADDLKLKPGMKATAAVKATNVTIELSVE